MSMLGGRTMTEESITWDDAIENTGFVVLEIDTPKKLKVTNWKLEKRPADSKVAAGEVEFVADVTEEDEKPVTEKLFTTTSKRLKTKLRGIFENKNPNDIIELSILRVGEQFNTQYSVKEL